MRKMRGGALTRRDRGDVLLQTIMFILVCTVIMTAISSLVLTQLGWSSHAVNQARAAWAAKAALNTAIGKLSKDQSFQEDIVFETPGSPEKGVLTFNPDSGRPYSTNNTRNSVSVEGWDGPRRLSDGVVLPNSVHLVAVGTCRNARYVSEAQIVFPAFPYALASTGEIASTGELKVEGVAELADGVDGVTDEEREAGHIVSNSEDNQSISLSAQAEVSGDVKSTGGIFTNGANVEGEVLPNQSDPSDLPKMALVRPLTSGPESDKTIYISDYDFKANPELQDGRNLEMNPVDARNESGGLSIEEYRVRIDTQEVPLELNQGLTLDDGALYVDGDLVIRGGVTGRGAITATGKITIHGPSALASDQVALLSGGGVNIDGQGLGISKFQGLVATLGNFEADSTSILGSFLAAGTDPVTQVGTSQMTIRDVHAIHAKDTSSMEIKIHVELKETLQGGFGERLSGGSQIGLLHNGTFYTFTGDPALSEAEQRAQVQETYRALLGVQGQPHPLAGGEIVLRTADGEYLDSSGLTPSQYAAFERFRLGWEGYTDKLEGGGVEEYAIFEIDLNRFTSGSSRIKILTYW